MSTTIDQLRSIKSGKSRRVRGQEVRRDGDDYFIDDERYRLDEAAKKIEQASHKSGLDYAWTVFIESPAGGAMTVLRHHRCRDRAEHTALLEAVRKRKNHLYYGAVVKDGNRYFAKPPFIIDWDSLPEHPDEVKKATELKAKPPDPLKWDGGLSCPFCGVAVSSTPGRTLHVKSQHPERLDEYKALLVAPVIDDAEDDVITRQNEVGLKCPFCDAKMSSTSGRTLHVQKKHPTHLDEYQKRLIGGLL